VQGNPFSVYGALALTNLEALVNGEGGATGTTTGEYVYYDFNGQRWYGVENEGTGKWFPKFDKCYIQGKSCVLYYRFGKLLEWNLLYSLN
jgi:hypothetical protein